MKHVDLDRAHRYVSWWRTGRGRGLRLLLWTVGLIGLYWVFLWRMLP